MKDGTHYRTRAQNFLRENLLIARSFQHGLQISLVITAATAIITAATAALLSARRPEKS